MDPRIAELKERNAQLKAQKDRDDASPGIDMGGLDMTAFDPSKVVMAETEVHIDIEDHFEVETALLHAISRNGFMRNPDRLHVQWPTLFEALKEIVGPYCIAEFCEQMDIDLPEADDPLDFLEEGADTPASQPEVAENGPQAPSEAPKTPVTPPAEPTAPKAKGGRRKRAAKKTATKGAAGKSGS